MSKTDKTKPWWVRVDEHHPVPQHDHRDGVCDLPNSYKDNIWSGRHCRWSMGIWFGCCNGCGCGLCTDQTGRKRKTRRQRRGARQQNLRYAQGAQW